MQHLEPKAFAPGVSVLGGAAGGLSYEGLMRDALGREERSRRLEAGRSRAMPLAQVQAPRPEPVLATQAEIAGQ